MSAPENQAPEPSPFDPTSSFEIGRNAKLDKTWRIKVRAQSNIPVDVRAAFDLAVKLDDELTAKYGAKAGAS